MIRRLIDMRAASEIAGPSAVLAYGTSEGVRKAWESRTHSMKPNGPEGGTFRSRGRVVNALKGLGYKLKLGGPYVSMPYGRSQGPTEEGIPRPDVYSHPSGAQARVSDTAVSLKGPAEHHALVEKASQDNSKFSTAERKQFGYK